MYHLLVNTALVPQAKAVELIVTASRVLKDGGQ
jgi:hypothetical protein